MEERSTDLTYPGLLRVVASDLGLVLPFVLVTARFETFGAPFLAKWSGSS